MIPGFIVAPLIISLVSAVLAAVISLVDKLVNNYGQVKIDINQGAELLELSGGTPLLFTLAEKKIFLPSACGGKGTCGACRVKVLSGTGPHLPTEIPLLSEQEIRKNIHLACQIKVKSDLSLEIPGELFNIKQYSATVEAINDVTRDIKEVYVKLDDPGSIAFKAGQYAQLIIPPYAEIKAETQRAYSILSTPAEKTRLGFLIRLVPGGIATTYIHKHLQAGDSLRLIAPIGDFYLRETGADMLCIAGGSGMAPIRSILFDMLEKELTSRNVWYFFGASTAGDLFYVREFRELEAGWPNFHFIPALSASDPGENWQGETGLITVILDRYLKEKIDPGSPKEGYLCGSPGMINACIKVLTANKVPEENIFYDKFA